MTDKPLPRLMTAKQVAEETGLPLRTAQHLVAKVARAHGGPVEVAGMRLIFVQREWVEASIGRGS